MLGACSLKLFHGSAGARVAQKPVVFVNVFGWGQSFALPALFQKLFCIFYGCVWGFGIEKWRGICDEVSVKIPRNSGETRSKIRDNNLKHLKNCRSATFLARPGYFV